MHLQTALEYLSEFPTPEKYTHFSKDLNPDWIEEALLSTGTATMGRRRLPAEQVVWLVIGMALIRDRPITEVVDKLDLALPKLNAPTVARSSIAQARKRLGDEPMSWLFTRCADTWAHASADRHRWRNLALYGVDGTTFLVPVTPSATGTISVWPTVAIEVTAATRWCAWSP